MSVSPRVAIALACDQGYAMPLATTLRSIVDSNVLHWPLDFHVLVTDFPEQVRRRVADSLPAGAAQIHWIPVDVAAFRGFSTAPGISAMTFARFLIPHAVPERVTRVLYLDSDILVLGDIAALWSQDLGDAVVGAVIDGIDAKVKMNSALVAAVPRVAHYFNAGVLLIDLARWKAERISERALDYLQRVPDSPFSDQDALNVACDGLWTALDPRWNFQAHLRVRIADLTPGKRPAIVHFITNLKPWLARSISRNSGLYDEYRSRTRFARTASERLADFLTRTSVSVHELLSRSRTWRAVWERAKHWTAAATAKPSQR